MFSSLTNPVDDRVFLVPLNTRQAADAATLSDEGQDFDDLVFIRVTAIEKCAFGLCECLFAGVASVPLATCFRLTKFDDVVLPFPLVLAIVWAGLIWTIVTYLLAVR